MLDVKTPEEVWTMIRREFAPLDETETVSLGDALGRVLAKDVKAEEYVPDFDRSTVDGYACLAADTFGCSDAVPAILSLAGEVVMGEAPGFALLPGECAAIPTGGELPEGADCAVMIEHSEDYGDGTVGILKSAAPGNNLIFRGDDVKPGKTVLKAGRVLGARDIGALAALGITEVNVARKLKVAVISTGDELVPPDDTPHPGQVRDVNGPMLNAMLKEFGAEPEDCGIVTDDEDLLRKKLDDAVRTCDAVILSGGSSAGVKDAAVRLIAEKGEVLLHGIAIKPGKPTIIGKTGNKPLIGLPGHPAAAFLTARLFVLPLLARLTGQNREQYAVTAELTESVGANHGRAQVIACVLRKDPERLCAEPIRSKAGLITRLTDADGFFLIARDCEGLPKGAAVQVYLH